MTAFNIVRFRVKPGHEEQFVSAHRRVRPNFSGYRGGALVKTGQSTYCIIGEWVGFKALADARPQMIGIFDTLLEDLGGGLGVTDPVSGDVVVRLPPSKSAKKRAKSKTAARDKRAGERKKRR